jgi:hypothetical protein
MRVSKLSYRRWHGDMTDIVDQRCNDTDVDPSGDGGGGLTATGRFCAACGAQSSPTAKFCSDCGTPVAHTTQSAEYKQVTVLFADVVHSMDIAAAVGAERLREIMTELVSCASSVGAPIEDAIPNPSPSKESP